ncbi:MAG: hypothetical protein A2Z35_03745 [Actinobacteria bacterium RBG_19FT_COMBO_36_27]|nr:MAG: hypothetical protein A2Z35_03745 [Actinobacteria bacterium RBG_19FT_COMBO_36_27]
MSNKLIQNLANIPNLIKIKKDRKFFIFFLGIFVILFPILFLILKNPGKIEAGWYSDTWAYRKKLTIDYTKVSGGSDLNNFPVLVSFSDSNLSKSQESGNDILFTSSDGITKLDHEIEKFTRSSGELVAWVRIPTLSASANTVIYIYYGNYSSPSQQNNTGVWDDNYVAVYHFSETSGQHLDSTGVNDSTSLSVLQQGAADGKIDGADQFDGTSSVITIADNDSLDLTTDLTLEAWIKPATYPSGEDAALIKKMDIGSPWVMYWLYLTSSGSKIQMDLMLESSGYAGAQGNTTLSAGNWYYVSGVRNDGTADVYVNGQNDTNWRTNDTNAILTGALNLYLGSDNGSSNRFAGYEDEIRISNIARTPGWIETTFNTINTPSTFFSSRGNEEKSKGPVLHFSFDEGYGTTVADSSAGGNTGTMAGAVKPSWQSESMCVSSKCLYFDGSSSSITVTNTINNVQTVSFWVRPKTNGEKLVDFDGTHYLSASNGAIAASGFSNPIIYVNGVSSTTLTADAWQHIEVTTSTRFNASSIKIGRISSSYLNGFIDEFKIYDYARTAAQVKTDYAGYHAPSGAAASFNQDNSPLSQGLVGYWKMNESTANTCSGGINDSCDSSGNSNDGSWNGDTTTTSGKFGNSATMDGSGDYIDVLDIDI